MPFTFAHPAAILPLRRFSPRYFNLMALAAGSMAPDTGYYVNNFVLSQIGHTLQGLIVLCLPAGLIYFTLFCLSFRTVAELLPEPHRQAWLDLGERSKPRSAYDFLVVCYSLVIGASTHLIWDSFTHSTGFFARQIPWLCQSVCLVGDYQITLCQILQHVSTFLGLYVLYLVYKKLLQRYPHPEETRMQANKRSLIFLALLITAPAILSLLLTASIFENGYNLNTFARFSFKATVIYVSCVVPLVLAVALVWPLAKKVLPVRD